MDRARVDVCADCLHTQVRLRICNAAVHEVLQLTRLNKIFEIRETEEEALQA